MGGDHHSRDLQRTNVVHAQASAGVVHAQASAGVGVEELCVGFTFPDDTTLPLLLPIRSAFAQRDGKTVLANLAQHQFTCREHTPFLEHIKEVYEKFAV